jgi:hypothetical protein
VSAPGLPPPLPADLLRGLRHPSERIAQGLCIGLGALVVMFLASLSQQDKEIEAWIFKGIGAAIAAYYWLQVRAARVRGNAILVSAEHWPELHALVQECQAKLGLKGLKAFVVQDLVLEQAGMRLSGEDCLLLRASMVDAALAKNDLQVLRFHIGRKCGQIAFGHYRFAANTLPGMGRLVYPLHAWYMRCQERSADRAGLWVAGEAALAHRGLAVLGGGVQIGGHLTPAAARLQVENSRQSLWVRVVGWHGERTFYPRRIVNLDKDAVELGVG